MGNLLGNAASEADPEGVEQTTKRMEEKEAIAKQEGLIKLKETQASALSQARARAGASGGGITSSLSDYFTSTERMFARENEWLSRKNASSGLIGEHQKFYESSAKNQGFGFLTTGKSDWWA